MTTKKRAPRQKADKAAPKASTLPAEDVPAKDPFTPQEEAAAAPDEPPEMDPDEALDAAIADGEQEEAKEQAADAVDDPNAEAPLAEGLVIANAWACDALGSPLKDKEAMRLYAAAKKAEAQYLPQLMASPHAAAWGLLAAQLSIVTPRAIAWMVARQESENNEQEIPPAPAEADASS